MSEWMRGSLGELASGVRGVSYTPNQLQRFMSPETVVLLRSNNIKGGQVNFDNVQLVPSHIVSNEQLAQHGDTAVCMSNGSKALVGKSGRIEGNEAPCTVGAFCSIFRPHTHADEKFVSYIFQSGAYRRHLDIILAGSAINNLRNSDVEALSLEIPPRQEQRLIAHILDTLDSQIQKTEALIAKLEKVKEGLLHDLLTRGIDENGQLRPSPEQAPELYKESPLGLIPISWHFAALGSLLDKIEAGKSPSCPDIPAPSGEWGVLKVSAVNPKGFRSTENKVVERKSLVVEGYEVKQGDLLITRANTPDLVGASCIVEEWTSRLMLSDKTLRLVENPDLVMRQYIYHSLQQSYVRKQISIAATGTSMSMKNISQGAIRTLSIIVPPIAEQSAICKRVAAISKRISHEQSKVSKLYQDKAGLMDDLLTGRVRVTPLIDQAQATPA
ncbi:restriction endonuclease subunit S [Halomonas salifodinae]|uniref:Restriction endonuclease subunit S n=1 Tax=Halomonas salifodinae TaxID=438745 RepID=A0ABW2F1H6_9GAMM